MTLQNREKLSVKNTCIRTGEAKNAITENFIFTRFIDNRERDGQPAFFSMLRRQAAFLFQHKMSTAIFLPAFLSLIRAERPFLPVTYNFQFIFLHPKMDQILFDRIGPTFT